jgi:hypothetical protein
MKNEDQSTNDLLLPEEHDIRKMWHQGRWFYSVVDVVAYLTHSDNARRYWSDLKRRVAGEGFAEAYARCVQLKMPSPDGKLRFTDAADRETLFRIIQSIPSTTEAVEQFKLWLAQSGEQRLQTIEQTGIDIESERQKYRLKGYSEEWIEKRIQSIIVRNELTQEWDERGAGKKDYGILTDTIAKGTFGVGTQGHKKLKNLKKENLRDHMTPMELVLTMLGEVTTTELHRDRDSQGLPSLQGDAHDGGAVAGRARQDIESQLGMSVVSPQNYLDNTGNVKRKQGRVAPQQPSLLDAPATIDADKKSDDTL